MNVEFPSIGLPIAVDVILQNRIYMQSDIRLNGLGHINFYRAMHYMHSAVLLL